MKKISVITVCLNEVKLIEKTLASVINQTFRDFEYIVIDGGSTDGTLEIIARYRDKIDKFVSEKDEGIYDAMNKGISLSEGEYVIFINGGDFLVNDRVFERVFDNNPSEDIIYTNGVILLYKDFYLIKRFPEKITRTFMYMDTLPHQNAFCKLDLLKKCGGFDKSLKIAADYDLFLKALYKFNASYFYLPIYIAVNNLDGVSNQRKFKKLTKLERYNSYLRYNSKIRTNFYRFFKPVYTLMIKYPKYLLDFIYSLRVGMNI